ncbi:MAG TPA: D-alanine--D-alanine ligase [Alphaproteobacteria bacterium]|nr:D-alanine--D-alanine ligase [Alphaproteobacteria bacterium]
MSKKVAVLMGGWSAEREISLVTGKACAKALAEAGYAVREIVVERDPRKLIDALEPRPDAVFNALHGRWGEDGTIQALLDLLELPYTHSGLLASALAMNKPMAKRLFGMAGIPVADGKVVPRERVLAGDVMPRPYVVKPLAEGSSVGVHIVKRGDNTLPFERERWPYGDEVLVERYIPGRELTVTVMGEKALAVTELQPDDGFYDYAHKYTDGRTSHLIPAPVPDAIAKACMDYALSAHKTLGCRGVSRADFRYDDTRGEPGEVFLLEINTQPGMTPLSLVPEQAAYLGMSFAQLVSWMVENAKCDR